MIYLGSACSYLQLPYETDGRTDTDTLRQQISLLYAYRCSGNIGRLKRFTFSLYCPRQPLVGLRSCLCTVLCIRVYLYVRTVRKPVSRWYEPEYISMTVPWSPLVESKALFKGQVQLQIAVSQFIGVSLFLADRTNGRAYATVLRLSVCLSVCRLSVCDVMYCG